jgi:16S rRNA (adenine1518-N6/adenine1519-N6)-dimethyltransferase
VLEVGPGRGALTAALAARAGRVVAVEIDRDLIATLRDRFAGSAAVSIVEADALRHEPAALLEMGGAATPYVVVANLPYNIGAPLLRRFLEAEAPPRRLVVMVQLEVAQAICAGPGDMSLIGVATQVYGEPRLVMKVAPGAFTPPPKVRSAVVCIDVAPRARVDAPLDGFFRVVRAGFSSPRKQLRNSLAFGLHVEHAEIDAVTRAADVDATLRPAMLSLDDWAAITRAWLATRDG